MDDPQRIVTMSRRRLVQSELADVLGTIADVKDVKGWEKTGYFYNAAAGPAPAYARFEWGPVADESIIRALDFLHAMFKGEKEDYTVELQRVEAGPDHISTSRGNLVQWYVHQCP